MSFTRTQNKFSKGIDDKADDTAVTVDESGKVGVGTDDPKSKFQVRIAPDLNIAMNQETAQDVARISAYDDAASVSVPLAIEGEYLKLRTNTLDRVTVNNEGNVGIGSPAISGVQAPLDVDKEPFYNRLLANFGEMTPENYARGVVNVNGRVAGSDGRADISFVVRTEANSNWLNGRMGLERDGSMAFSVGGVAATDAIECMRIDGSGRVGIGTDNPTDKLEVLSTSVGDYNVAGFYRNADVATGGPAGSFILVGSRNGNTRVPAAGFGALLDDLTDTGSAIIQTRTGGVLTEKMRIDDAGNVGIGRPDTGVAKVRIKGNGTTWETWGLLVEASDGSPTFTVKDNGDATFTGDVSAKFLSAEFLKIRGRTIYTDHFGIQMGSTKALLPSDSDGLVSSAGESDIGSRPYPFKDVWLAGNVYPRGGNTPLASTRDLIETLSTLRAATQDETTIEGLRDSIGNAIGGLIEKFEAMQNEAGTMDLVEE